MNSRIEEHTVPELEVPVRLQEYGVGIFLALPTKSSWKKALKKDQVRVNANPATTGTWIKGGESIELSILDQIGQTKSFDFPLEVLFEDDHFAVIFKPAGIPVSGNGLRTVANALTSNLKPSTLPDSTIPHPVHRLDYPTTGALLVGKTKSAIRALSQGFENHNISKVYYAVTIGEMPNDGEITEAIDSKNCHSKFEIIGTQPSERFGQLNLVKLVPLTGRRHQLRVHMASIGNPILGDREYGKDPLILKGKGLYLHAHTLELQHPITLEKIRIIAPVPQKFRKIFNRF